jgi:hypothetical protein
VKVEGSVRNEEEEMDTWFEVRAGSGTGKSDVHWAIHASQSYLLLSDILPQGRILKSSHSVDKSTVHYG